MRHFTNRTSAGRLLAAELRRQLPPTSDGIDTLVLALPRGGVPIAAEVARALHADLDLMIVRKLGVPGHEELAMGAIASGGVQVLNEHVIASGGIGETALAAVAQREQRELARRETAYRGDRPHPALARRRVILVDDGVATGATMLAAIAAAKLQGPAELIVAVPLASPDTLQRLRAVTHRVVCLLAPEPFFSIGQWYQDFSQTEDDEVKTLLAQAWGEPSPPPGAPLPGATKTGAHEQRPR